MDLIFDTPLPAGTLEVDNSGDVTRLGTALAGVEAIALRFPRWTDGRAYSQARLLRSRVGFSGRLIATGEVLVDMLPLLQRCGFDAAALRDDQDLAAARRVLGHFNGHQMHYQADLISKLPHYARSAYVPSSARSAYVPSSARSADAPQPARSADILQTARSAGAPQ